MRRHRLALLLTLLLGCKRAPSAVPAEAAAPEEAGTSGGSTDGATDATDAAAADPSTATSAAATTTSEGGGATWDVRRIDATHYDVKRAFMDRVLSDGGRIVTDGGIVPHVPSGVRMLRVRPGSDLARLGATSGDVVQSVNGVPIPRGASGLANQLRGASTVSVVGKRDDKPITILYRIVP